jgi:hypothetical protein
MGLRCSLVAALMGGCTSSSPRVETIPAQTPPPPPPPTDAGVSTAPRDSAKPPPDADVEHVDRERTLAAITEFLRRTETHDTPVSERTGAEGTETPTGIGDATAEWIASPENERRSEDRTTDDTPAPATLRARRDAPSITRPATVRPEHDPQSLPGSATPTSNRAAALEEGARTHATTPALPVVRRVSLQRSPTSATPEGSTGDARLSNAPLEVGADRPGTVTAEELADRLSKDARATGDPDTHWRAALLNLALGRSEAARERSSRLANDPAQILDRTLDAVEAARLACLHPDRIDDELVGRADALVTALAERSDPTVSVPTFCRRVRAFGVYEEMEDTRFVAGQPIETIVYCEVRNFRSEPSEDGTYRTLLGTRLEVMSDTGETLWTHEEPQIEDRCRTRRNDFFLVHRIVVPATIPAGSYLLKLTVEDRLSGRLNQASRRFRLLEQGVPATASG